MFNFVTRKLRLLMVGPVAALGLIAFAQAAAAQPSSPVQASPSLAGETLQTEPNGFNEQVFCTNGPTGASYESFLFAGVATGPYPGTFTETFTMTTDNSGTTTPPGTSGRVLTFTAQFSIEANDGTVITGTKTLQAGANSGTGSCEDFVGSVGADGPSGNGILTDYTAQITGPSGTTTDQGTAQTSFVWRVNFLPGGEQTQDSNFTETFGASQGQKPGQGCSDRNHSHEREGNCKKPAT